MSKERLLIRNREEILDCLKTVYKDAIGLIDKRTLSITEELAAKLCAVADGHVTHPQMVEETFEQFYRETAESSYKLIQDVLYDLRWDLASLSKEDYFHVRAAELALLHKWTEYAQSCATTALRQVQLLTGTTDNAAVTVPYLLSCQSPQVGDA